MNVVESAIGHDHDDVAGATLGDDSVDYVIGAAHVTGSASGTANLVDELLNRQALALGQRRPEDGRDEGLVGRDRH